MPNWCINCARIEHPNPEVLEALLDEFQKDRFCEAAAPEPERLMRGPKNSKEVADLLYDFRLTHWGTARGVSSADADVDIEGNELVMIFNSAWTPPIGVYRALEAKGFTVRAMYCETGNDLAGFFEAGQDERMSVRQALESARGGEFEMAFPAAAVNAPEDTDESPVIASRAGERA